MSARYVAALATVMRGSAVPYGYTVTVWTSGMMLTRERGTPSVGQVFLFMAGAVCAFAVLGSFVNLMRGEPFEAPYGSMRHAGMMHFLAVGGTLGVVTLIALIHSGIVWPVGAFVATASYLSLTTLELTITVRIGRRPDG